MYVCYPNWMVCYGILWLRAMAYTCQRAILTDSNRKTQRTNLFVTNPNWFFALVNTAPTIAMIVQDGDEGVALESCEFWTAFCEAQVEPGVLRPFLGRLVPVLLKNMVYDEYDEEVQDAEAAEDADHGDEKDQEIKPFVRR